jgi:hypothetical protein
MSYEKIIRQGKPFFLCWNCGRIEMNEEKALGCEDHAEFTNKLIDYVSGDKDKKEKGMR